jgi:hypothetical protein
MHGFARDAQAMNYFAARQNEDPRDPRPAKMKTRVIRVP